MGDVDVTTAQDGSTTSKVNRPVLTAMVIGSMVGAGVFSLPARFGTATGVFVRAHRRRRRIRPVPTAHR
ncbi:MAG: hypothetical protein ABWY50_10330, partial [Aeromicrobium sp.]